MRDLFLLSKAQMSRISPSFPHSHGIPRVDGIVGGVSKGIARSGAPIPPETRSSNLRWLYGYRVFLESNQEWDVRTVDEYLRALSRMSAFFGHKPFETHKGFYKSKSENPQLVSKSDEAIRVIDESREINPKFRG